MHIDVGGLKIWINIWSQVLYPVCWAQDGSVLIHPWCDSWSFSGVMATLCCAPHQDSPMDKKQKLAQAGSRPRLHTSFRMHLRSGARCLRAISGWNVSGDAWLFLANGIVSLTTVRIAWMILISCAFPLWCSRLHRTSHVDSIRMIVNSSMCPRECQTSLFHLVDIQFGWVQLSSTCFWQFSSFLLSSLPFIISPFSSLLLSPLFPLFCLLSTLPAIF